MDKHVCESVCVCMCVWGGIFQQLHNEHTDCYYHPLTSLMPNFSDCLTNPGPKH